MHANDQGGRGALSQACSKDFLQANNDSFLLNFATKDSPLEQKVLVKGNRVQIHTWLNDVSLGKRFGKSN